MDTSSSAACGHAFAPRLSLRTLIAALLLAGAASSPAAPATIKAAPDSEAAASGEAVIGPAVNLVIGKSTLLRMPAPIDRVSVGNPAVADVTVLSSRELYLLGKVFGSTNLITWSKDGGVTVVDVQVNPDTSLLQGRLQELLPGEKDIKVSVASDSVVLTGKVSSAIRAGQAVEIAEAFVAHLNRGISMPSVAGDHAAATGTQLTVNLTKNTSAQGQARVVNMLKIAEPQQVMLEVKVAEVQKTLLDKLGAKFNMDRVNGSWTYSILSDFLTNSAGLVAGVKSPTKLFALDAAKKDGLIKVLAEPNIVAVSGQEASFLAGGKIFIPVASSPNALTGVVTVTLEEKEFGVGVKFTPTVLEGGRINLKVAPEVSELSQTGTPFTTINNITAILPSMTTRRAQTTVQLNDGQSLAIAGLIKNNVNGTVDRFPALGEIPILGALFRSNEFQAEQTELMFVITPRLVKPLPPNYALPTDSYVPPDRADFFLNGKLEGRPAAPAGPGAAGEAQAEAQPGTPVAEADRGGFEVK